MKNLSKKLVEVMKDCGHVAKNGSNSFHNYKYATAAYVLQLVNSALTKYGIMSAVETNLLEIREVTTAKGNSERLATVETVVTLTDSDSGEQVKIKGLGSGQDAGDKATMKAQTAAIKYAFLLSFAISTGDDPEADIHTDEVMTVNKNKFQPSSQHSLTCADCGKNISQKIADYSQSKYGRFLCYDCQQSLRKVA